MTPWQADRARYPEKAFVREQSLWAISVYRCGRWNDARPRGVTRWLYDRLYWFLFRIVETLTVPLVLVAVPEQEPLAVARARGALDPAHVLVVEFLSLEDLRNALLDGNVQAGVFPLDDALWLTGSPANARIEHFVGIQHQQPITRRLIQGKIARRGEVVGL